MWDPINNCVFYACNDTLAIEVIAMKAKIQAYWHLFKTLNKTTFQLLYGVWKVSNLPQPRVTIFGGARVKQDSSYARLAHELTHKLIQENISVITGGGPGIMAASSCTFVEPYEKKLRAKTLGITVKGLEIENMKPGCDYEHIVLDYFYARKWLMINYSVAFAVFPGGFGTVDELAEVITLMQTKKLPGIPVVLLGTQYWEPFMDWVHNSALKHGLISQEDINLIRITDDIDHAVKLLKERCEVCT